MSKSEKKIEKAYEAGVAYIRANRNEHALGIINNSPLPKKKFGKRMSKAEKFELLHFAAVMGVRDKRATFEGALGKLNKEEAAILAEKLQGADI